MDAVFVMVALQEVEASYFSSGNLRQTATVIIPANMQCATLW